MTQTIDPAAPAPARSSAPTRGCPASRTRSRPRDVERAAGMFAATSFWRDLVAFSWNITTVEDPAGVADLLTATLERTDPSGFATSEPPDEADGVTTAWFTFETAVGRGRGLLRLVDEDGEPKAWTFLTTLYELKGHEEPRGERRPMGAEHGADKDRDHLARAPPGRGRVARLDHPALRAGDRRRPGRHRPRRPAAPARRAQPGDRQARPARRPVAQPLQVALPARPGLVRPPALPEVPGQLAGVRPQGQDRRLAGVLHEGDGGAVLDHHRRHAARRTTEDGAASGRSRSSARASR